MLKLLVMLLVFCNSLSATTYYLSATGSDANSGFSAAAPWLTPNHPVNCGDTILAAPSTAYSNLHLQVWGEVHCPGNNNVAWLKCAVFDACKVMVPPGGTDLGYRDGSGFEEFDRDGINITSPYWGVQGWEVHNNAGGYNGVACFGATPRGRNIHHVIFANNVANTCPLSAFGAGENGPFQIDYIIIVGNIAYNGGTTDTGCGSNIDIFSPVASDSAPGTHIFVAGNLSYHSANPADANCYDGNGIIFDTFDANTSPGLKPYTQQAVIANNIALSSGGRGIEVEYNSPADFSGTVPAGVGQSKVYVLNNTIWGNGTGVGSNGYYQIGSPDCGEFHANKIQNITVSRNLAATNSPGCYQVSSNPNYAFALKLTDGTSTVTGNWGYSPYGYQSNATQSASFSFGANVFGFDPKFVNAVEPGAPDCSAYADVPHCMASVIEDFRPQTIAAQTYGFQKPKVLSGFDPLFPLWLCTVDLPPGLVTTTCPASLIRFKPFSFGGSGL